MERAGVCIAFTAPPALSSMGATSVVLVPPPHPDQALLAMAADLQALEESGLASPRWRELFTAIGRTRAQTLDGIKAKAWAASLVVELDSDGQPMSTEQQLLQTLCQDIARIGC
jgi:hypothetical protein